MPHNMPLTFELANRRDFDIPILVLFVLVAVSALLSPQPVLLTLLTFVLFGAGLFVRILVFSNVNDVRSSLVIFPDGQLQLEYDQKHTIKGLLNGQQWCSHYVSVLQYLAGGKRQHLVVLSAKQNADDYRRLKVWLRQDFCNDTGKKQVSGCWPAGRA